ncbi:PAS domain S-box-containing protein [Bacillus ectoiniformans]|uniref:PAS domain-containing sensor histidine kinase n=1 Tax=Bacillus ectoiniformans TaxID=1494429 RepID=UPI00195B6A25|nr:PAS domain-containing sensor histidine kinase [Bacillus ectoiniformans]MBM7649217.1 PAS domain S-box-containing protein [Bacillus ectoiniformans]
MELFLYKQSFEHSGIAQALYDSSFKMIDMNHEFLNFFEVTQGERANQYLAVSELNEQERQAIQEGLIKSVKKKINFLTIEGSLKFGLLTVCRLEDEKGKVFFLSQIQDLTENILLEKELRKQNKFFHFLMKYSNDVLTIHSPDGICTYSSPLMDEMLGFSVGEFIEKDLFEFIHPDDLDEVSDAYIKVRETSETIKALFRHRTAGGEYKWIESISRAARDPITNEVLEVISNCRDVTERQVMEFEIKKTNQKNERILNSIRDGFLLLDQEYKIVYMNKVALERTFSISDGVKYKRNFFELFPDLRHTPIYDSLKQAVSSQQPIECEFYWEKRRDWYNMTLTPTSDGIFIHSSIVTNYKEALHHLAESEQRYRRLVEHSPEAVIVHNYKEILYVNERALALFEAKSEEQFLKSSVKQLVGKKEYIEVIKSMNRIKDDQTGIVHSSGKIHTFLNNVREVESASMKILFDGKWAIHSLVRDVTEKKYMEQLLHKSEKLAVVGELAAAFAHEVRNPLTSIKGFLQLAHSLKTYNEEYMEIVLTELHRVETIIYEFLSLAKPHQETKFVKTDIKQLIKQIVYLLESQALINNQLLSCSFTEEPVMVECEPNLIKQVLINVIKNALESLGGKGTVDIEVKTDRKTAKISVKDTGCGIPLEKIHRLGEPFYSTKEKGTGLGLMTSMKIIENHNGLLKITSEINQGTTVQIILPKERTGADKQQYEFV